MINFTDKPSQRELFHFLLPLVLSSVFLQLFTPVSAAVAGRYLSEKSVAVIGASSACKVMLNFLFASTTTGFSFYVNRAAGTGDRSHYRNVFQSALVLGGILILTGVVFAAAVEPIMTLGNIPDTMRAEARRYLRLLLLDGGLWGLQNLLICVLQGTGETRFPSMIAALEIVVQTLLAAWLLSWRRMGIEAVSLALLLSHTGMCVILFGYMLFRKGGRDLLLVRGEFCTEIFVGLFQNGGAKSLMMLLIGTGYFFLQRRVNEFSVDIIAGYTYASALYGPMSELLSSYAVAAGIMSAQTAGREDYRMLSWFNRKMMRRSLIWYAVFALTVTIAAPHMIYAMAGGGASSELITAGVKWFRIAVYSFPLLSGLMICRNALQGMGYCRVLILLGALEMAVKMSTAWIFVPLFGYAAVCYNEMFELLIPCAAAVWIYRKKVRRRLG